MVHDPTSGGLGASSHTGAFCHARQRLPTQMIRELVCYSGTELASRVPEQWKWMQRDVKLVYALTVTIVDGCFERR